MYGFKHERIDKSVKFANKNLSIVSVICPDDKSDK
jgi:hypothetical protein